MNRVVSYESSIGAVVNLCEQHAERRRAEDRWPRDGTGEQLAAVRKGLSWGQCLDCYVEDVGLYAIVVEGRIVAVQHFRGGRRKAPEAAAEWHREQAVPGGQLVAIDYDGAAGDPYPEIGLSVWCSADGTTRVAAAP